MQEMVQWTGLKVVVAWSRLVAVGMGEVAELERYFEGGSWQSLRKREVLRMTSRLWLAYLDCWFCQSLE